MSIKQVKDGCWTFSDGEKVCYPYPEDCITPTGDISITENGEFDVTEFAKAIVNVGDGGDGGDETSVVDSLINGSITKITSNVKNIGDTAFSNRKRLLLASFPLAETVGDNSFVKCEKLTTIKLPKASLIKRAAFQDCTSLKEIDLSSATNFGLGYTFLRCYVLETVYLGGAYSIPTGLFNNCYSLKNLVIRDTKFVPSYGDPLKDCYHMLGTVNTDYNPNGDKDGYIYVQSALIEEYKAATNWSAYATQFRALEDYTVDGTITGELDESKI